MHDSGHGGHDKHAGHDPEMFRRRFWLSLCLTVPLVVTSEMVMDWFGYRSTSPAWRGSGRCSARSCSSWGGWPFLVGGVARGPRPRSPG